MAEWITVKEASELLKISRRQVINKVNAGQLKAKREGRLWFIHESLLGDTEEVKGTSQELPKGSQDFSKEVGNLEEMVEFLKKQLEEKDQQINQQQAIIMQLSRNQQLMLESSQMKAKRSWWSKWFRHYKK